MSDELVSDVPLSEAVGALAPSQAQPVDDVSAAVGQIKQQRDLSLQSTLTQAVQVDPEKAAKVQALSDKTGVPVDVLNRNEEAIAQRSRVRDITSLMASSPILEQQMRDPRFAALAHDDVENLNPLELLLRTYLGASTKAGIEQLLGVGSKLIDVSLRGSKIFKTVGEEKAASAFADRPALELQQYLNDSPALMFSRFARAMQEASTESMKNLSPAAQLEYGDLRYATLDPSKAAYLSPIKVVGDAIQSLPTSLALGISVYLTKGVAARVEAGTFASLVAGGMEKTAAQALAREAAIHAGSEMMAITGAATEGAAGYGQQYMQTRQQADTVTEEQLAQSPEYQKLVGAGYSPAAARLRLSAMAAETAGAAGGVVDAITNYFGGRFLGTILTEGGRVAARTAKGFTTEALTEAVQSGLEQLSQNVAVRHYLDPGQDPLDQVMENIVMGFAVGGVTGGAFGAMAGRSYQKEAATSDAAVLTKMSELAAQSELRARAPETFAQFMNAAAADGPVDALYIDAKTFAQSMAKAGMDDTQLAQKMPETAAQMVDALATDGKVRIPTGEFMATFPGSGIEKELIRQVSTTPDGPTVAEAHDAAFVAEAQKQVEAVMAKHEFKDAIRESSLSVEGELLAQMTKANRFTKDVNAAYAKLMASFYTVMSQRIIDKETGKPLTPEQMYVKYPLNIRAESVASAKTLEQPRAITSVGYWEGPGGEHVETDHVPTLAERAAELAQNDRRWQRYPNAPAVFKSNRGELAQQENKTALTKFTEGSKVTGVMYHGTASDVVEPSGMTWLAYDAKTAALYADRAAYDEAQQEKPDDERIDINEYNPEYEGVVQGGQNIMPVVVSAKNPLDLRDLGGSSNLRDVFAELQKKGVIPADENVQDAQDFIDNPDATSVYQLLEELNVYDDVKKKGYDSVIITDVDTTGNYHDSVGVFEPTQIKSAIGNRGTFDPNNPNILAQTAFDKPSLIIQHNLTAENLHHAATFGGIPVPSLAITRAQDAATGFGEITLIGKKEMANPRGYARTKVFGGDLYAPRYPEISYKLNNTALKKLNAILTPYRVEGGRELYGSEINNARDLVGNKAFDRWAADNFKEDGGGTGSEKAATILLNEIGAQQRIFRGFTAAGNRRYVPHTLENVVRILKQNLRGGESESNIYGMGQLRAKFTPQFSSITEIREAAGRIVSDEDFEKVKKEVETAFWVVKDALGPYSNRTDWATSFHSSNTAMAIIEDAQRMGINAATKEYGFDELPEDVRQKMLEFVTRLRNMPTEYFEAKILREVGISEFAAAVVPHNIDEKTRDLLLANGLDVSTYQKENYAPFVNQDAARKAKIAEVAARLGSNVLFQEAPQLPAPAIFYSQLQRQVEALKLNIAPADQWKKAIEGLMSKGVKKAEIEVSGVMDWLDMQLARENEQWGLANATGQVIASGDEEQKAGWLKNKLVTERGYSVVPMPADSRGRITKDEVLAYLHSDGETEVRTTIFGEAQQPTDIIESDEENGVSEERIEQRAEQLWRDQLQAEAERNASEDDYYTYSDPLVRTPNYKIEKLPADMLRGGDQYGVKELTWDMPTGKDMPDDAEELASMYPGGPREKWLEHFGTEAAAEAWAQQHEFEDGHKGYNGKPYWTSQDGNGDEIGEYDDKSEAEAGIQSHKEQDFQYAVESYIDNASWSEADQEHFIDDAREELTDETPRQRNQRLARGNVLPLRHENSYQLPGGKNQRELVVWIPDIQPYATSDRTHYGDVGEGRAIAWARLSQFDDANGKPVLMVNEFQSLRAQTGRQEGFSGELFKQYVVFGLSGDRVYVSETKQDAESFVLSHYPKQQRGATRIEEVMEQRATGVPSAPFVKDTQAWVALDMKRVIRYAVDNGLDTVTWTTAKQQVGIYSGALQDAIKTLDWKKTADGIEITANGRNVNRTFSDKELRVAAGGAITDQIVNSKEQEGTISGSDIRFDAVWPYSFYGDEKGQGPLNQKEIDVLKKAGKPIPDSKPSIVTAVTDKILASIGGGKVESIDVPGVENKNVQYVGPELTKNDLVRLVPKIQGNEELRFTLEAVIGELSNEGAKFSNWMNMFVQRNKKRAYEVAAVAGGAFAEPTSTQPGFRITPQMKEAVMRGFPLFQKGEGGQRGGISFGEGIGKSPATIMLLQNADLSTFLHESGHFYLEVLNDLAKAENAPPEIAQDMNKILNWFGVPNAAVWNAMTLDEQRPYHEQFARGFESYLFSGTAPSPELKSIFSRFRAWLLNVYRQLSNLNVQLTDEVRGVMDRMLATNSEIIAAENARGFAPLFESAQQMGASEAEWKAYQEQNQQATQDAVDTLQTRSLRDMRWLSNARSAALKRLQQSAQEKRKGVRAEVAAEVNAEPIYQATRWLKTGETTSPEGEAVKATQGFKLDAQALEAMYPSTMLARPDLTKLGSGKYGMVTAKDGLHPDLVAEMFGFGSGDELVRKLIDTEPARSVIEGKTDQRMLERYGDLTDAKSIAAAADAAVHNEARARFIATELNALNKATGQKKLLTKAARQFAESILARKKLRDIRPAMFENAEARAARATEKALSGSKLVEAATEKRNELVNNYAAKAAHAALDEIEKNIAYLRKVSESKTIDPAYREQIQAMLERFDLRAATLKAMRQRASLVDWIQQQKDNDMEAVIDPEIANEAMRLPYRELTLEQFRGLVDSVRNIEHLGRLKNKLLKLADQREFAKVVDEAVAAITANAKKTIPQRLEGNTWSAAMKDGVTEFFAMHRKFASLIREMDGFVDGGPLWQLFSRPMNQSGDTETLMREQATLEMQRIFQPLLDFGHLKEKAFIPEINANLSREGRIMVALNTGNSGNLQRLMDGDHWTKAQVDAIVDTLTKSEMDFVQNVWDFVGSYRKQVADQQRRLTGVEPEWVEPRQVVTQHGVYRGGYLPAKYDTTRSTRALADEAAAGIMDEWRGARGIAKARDSFTKERANKVVDRPLRKDFGVITQHVTGVIHWLSWQEYLSDANRLLRSKGIDTAIREHYGHKVLEELRDTLADIATGELPAQNAFEKSVNYIRMGATIAGLGWRVTTSLLQPIGLTQSMMRIGPKYVARGLAEWIGDSVRMENTAKRIYEKSTFMRLRAKTLQREINEIRNAVNAGEHGPTLAAAVNAVIPGAAPVVTASYFYLITKLQLVADIPTWLGQYHKAIENNADEMNARAQADQAVIDAQGSGQLKDLAAIQRGGPMMKLFTNFYSFFNTTYNMTSEAFGRTNFKNPFSIGRLMVDVLLLYSVPAALGTFMKAALHSGDDTPDWEDKLVRQLIADQMTYWLGTMVGLRELSGAAQTALGLSGDYQGPASVRLFASVAELGKQINQGDADEAAFKALDSVGGVLFHFPSGQINATMDGIVTMAQGKTDNPGALIVGSNRK